LQRPNHHAGWGQSLLILNVCAWNEERPSLLFRSRFEISTSLAIPFWAWINFLSWKKSRLGSHPTLGGKRTFQWETRKCRGKAKSQKSPRNSNARGHAQITRKSDIQDKVSMPYKSKKKEKGQIKKKAAKENMNDVKSQTVDSDPQSLKPWNTLWALWTIFFHSQKPQPTLRACRSPF